MWQGKQDVNEVGFLLCNTFVTWLSTWVNKYKERMQDGVVQIYAKEKTLISFI